MISIDVFDTAIFRKVYKPEDIFKLINDEGFYKKRIETEIRLREENPYFNLDDIYEILTDYDKNIEIEAELANTEANPDILKVYNGTPQKFVFISDMYLPSEVIKNILENAGYENPRVFVSQELKACKATGELFKKVEGIIGEKINLHYGDNYIADIEGAKKVGIKPVFNPALKDMNLTLPEVKDPFLKNYVARSLLLKGKEEFVDLSTIIPIAKIITPILVDFVKWVLAKRDDENKKILFLARDMKLPYLIAKNIFKAKNIEYVYASRKALESIIRESKDPMFNNKLDLVSKETTCTTKEVKKYFDKVGVKEGDYIVDIGYSGTALFALQELYGIKLKGLFMQKETKMHEKLDVDMYFSRNAIKFPIIVEFFISSEEDCLVGYKNGEPVFSEDSGKRKYLAKVVRINVEKALENKDLIERSFNIFDIEQILIYLQLYCPDEFLDLYNQPLMHNRELKESMINYNREGIKIGMLKELYDNSYAKPLFLRMLSNDKEFYNLKKYLT